jgi:V8-like Glu-specific endopeptidase
MNMFKRLVVLLTVLAVLCGSTPLVQAQEGEPNTVRQIFLPSIGTDKSINASELVVSQIISEAEQQAALKFWTREAIAAAEPMEMIAQFGPEERGAGALSEPEVDGPHSFVAAGRAAPNADRIARAAYPQDWANLEAELEDADVADVESRALDGTAGVRTSYRLSHSALQTMYPHRWFGRLSFRKPDGTTSFCSGSAISGNVMVTAAHCLYDTTNNRWYTNRVFTPAYRNGNAPYGSFTATGCWVTTAWVNLTGSYSIGSWARHDVGVCKMGKNSAGLTLNQAVGSAGREVNTSYTRHVHNLGYPHRDFNNNLIPDAGRYLHTCVAETFQGGTEYRGMGCDWGGGNSGAGWMTGYAIAVVKGNLTGVHSGGVIGQATRYGARFNSSNIVVLCASTAAAC